MFIVTVWRSDVYSLLTMCQVNIQAWIKFSASDWFFTLFFKFHYMIKLYINPYALVTEYKRHFCVSNSVHSKLLATTLWVDLFLEKFTRFCV